MFATTIKLGKVTKGTASNGNKFKTAKGSTLFKKDGTQRTVTVQAFGKQLESVNGLLRTGRTVELFVTFDGPNIKVIGPVIPKAEQADEAAAA